jgi:hypothetical protein
MAKAQKVQLYQQVGEAFIVSNGSNNYGCGMFLLDCLLTLVTGGLWLIWVFVREMRKR